jgi:ATP-dependent DNA helicase RecG
VRLDIEDGAVDGVPVVVAQVSECDRSVKPCRVASTGKSYIRGYDGDFLLSELEEQAFLAARKPPMFDRAPVEDATVADLDEALQESFSRRSGSPDRLALGAGCRFLSVLTTPHGFLSVLTTFLPVLS